MEYTKGANTGAIVHEVSPLDVKEIRHRLRMTQEEFAEAVGVKLPTLRHWERGDRRPNGPARVLLNLLSREPEQIVKIAEAGSFLSRFHCLAKQSFIQNFI